MPSTHLSLHYHLIFSTKDRIAYIHQDWCDRLHAYMGGIVRDLGGVPEAVGGVEDHVHLLVGLRATHQMSEVLKEIKGSSSKWVHQELKKPLFSWQEGYGAFTIGMSGAGGTKNYIATQAEHHRKKTFQDEFRSFLEKHGLPYDNATLWD